MGTVASRYGGHPMANLSVASIFSKAKGVAKSSKTTAGVIRRRRNFETANKRLLVVAQTVLLSQLTLPAFAQHAAMSPLPSSPASTAGNAVGVPLHSSIATTPTHSAPTPSVVPTSVLTGLGSLVSNSGSLVIDFGKLGGQMNYGLNSLSNSGTIYLVSSDSHITNAVLSLNSLLNTGAITSVIPQGGLAGYSNLVPNLNVTINALQHVINAGTITSAAALNVNAGGAIYNAPISQNAAAPVMQAATNLSLTTGAGAITNSGLMQSVAGNINVATTAANITQDLVFNNQAGTLQALQGAINFRDPSYIGTGVTSIIGAGDILAQTMNVNGGKGLVTVSSNTLTPVLNVVGCDASITASTGALNIGTLDLSGDPVIYNDNGDVLLSGNLSGDGSLSIVATGSILGSATIVRTGGEGTSSPATVLLHAYQDIILSGSSVIKAPGTIQLVAEQGSVIAPGYTIHSDSTSPRDFGSFLFLPYTISVFAHSSINVGAIDNPGGFLALRAGGDIAGTTFYPGANPGSTTFGHINIYNSKNTGPTGFVGQVWIDDLGGPVNIGTGIHANGASINIQSSDSITIGGPGILNTATIDPVGANISLYSRGTFTGQIQNNCFGCSQGGQVIAQAVDFNIANGIKNNSSGGGGRVIITGTSATELNVGQGGLEIFDNAQTDGGLVSVTNYGPVTYSGGIHTANQGNGATVYLTSQAGLATVNSQINVSSTAGVAGNIDIEGGGGAVINRNLTANGAGIYSGIIVGGSGDVVVNGNLSANGTTGAGSIIVTNYGTPTGTAIVNGNLTANSAGGVGGNVSLYASGASTVLVNPGSSISANGAAGGGTVTVKTSNGFVLNGQSISANGTGSSANGGTISLTDGGVVTPPTEGGPITVNSNISANAGGTGTGGYVTISTSGAGNAVTIGSPRISAQGGTVSGDGGNIFVTSPGALTVTNSFINFGARGSGNGGNITMTAGAAGSGDLNFTGTMIVDGEGAGNGGTITVNSLAGNAKFNHPVNGAEFVSAVGGALAPTGNGGTINLSAAGDLLLLGGNVNASSLAQSGNGGTIYLTAGTGGLGQLVYDDNITANGGMQSGSGGYITLTQESTDAMQVNGNIRADGAGLNPGGVISFVSTSSGDFTVNVKGQEIADGLGTFVFTGSNLAANLHVALSGKLNAGAINGSLGSVQLQGATNILIDGSGTIIGGLTSSPTLNETINLFTPITINRLQSSGGNISITTPTLTLAPNAVINVSNSGIITITADKVNDSGSMTAMSVFAVPKTSSSSYVFGNITASQVIDIRAAGDASIQQSPGAKWIAPIVNLSTEVGDIGKPVNRIQLSADFFAGKTSVGTVAVANDKGLTIVDSTGGNGFDIQAAGTILVAGMIQTSTTGMSGVVKLETTDNNGSVILSGSLRGETILCIANGSGQILQTSGTLVGSEVVLRSGSGDIGFTTLRPIVIQADGLFAASSNGGNISILNLAGSTGVAVEASKSFAYSSPNDTVLGGINASSGVSIIGYNSAKISLVGKINADTVSLGTDSGNIEGKAGGSTGFINCSTLTMVSRNGNIGTYIESGRLLFSPIHSSASIVSAQTLGSVAIVDVATNVSLQNSSAGQNFNFTSDSVLTIGAVTAGNKLSVHNNSSVIGPGTLSMIIDGPIFGGTSVHIYNQGNVLLNGPIVQPDGKTGLVIKDGQLFKAISYSSGTTFVPEIIEPITTITDLWANQDTEGEFQNAHTMRLRKGKVLLHPKRHLDVITPFGKLVVPAGAVILANVTVDGDSFIDLHQSGLLSICKFYPFGNCASISFFTGQELVIGSTERNLDVVTADLVPRRRVSRNNIDRYSLQLSEASPLLLLQNDSLLRKLLRDKSKRSTAMINRLLKSSACVQTATVNHGPYSIIEKKHNMI